MHSSRGTEKPRGQLPSAARCRCSLPVWELTSNQTCVRRTSFRLLLGCLLAGVEGG